MSMDGEDGSVFCRSSILPERARCALVASATPQFCMKFERRFFFSVIPEWKDQYIALEALLKQIESIKNAAIRLVQSIANIKSTPFFAAPNYSTLSLISVY